MATSTREELRNIVEALTDEQLSSVLAYARSVHAGRIDFHVTGATTSGGDVTPPLQLTDEEMAADPMLRILAQAPEDDEPLSAEEIETIRDGVAEYRRNDYVDSTNAKRAHLR